jgi:hypothetical protein
LPEAEDFLLVSDFEGFFLAFGVGGFLVTPDG